MRLGHNDRSVFFVDRGAQRENFSEQNVVQAANAAVDAGAVVVAGGGNDAFTNALGSPACGSKVIAVGVTYDDTFDNDNCDIPGLTSFSFRNCTDDLPQEDSLVCFSNKSANLDVTALGCVLFSADLGSTTDLVGICGTSQAAPHVAGLAALILDLNPALSPTQVRQIIRDGAMDLGAPGFDTSFGHGRIDVLNSLALAEADANEDGISDTVDVCPNSPAPGGVDAEGRPLGNVDHNCTVDLLDHAITTRNFTGP